MIVPPTSSSQSMPSEKLIELCIKKFKSGIKEKWYDAQGLFLILHPNGTKREVLFVFITNLPRCRRDRIYVGVTLA